MEKGQVLAKLDSYMQGIKLDFNLMPLTKVNSKQIKDLVRLKATKLPEENREKALWHWIWWFPVYNTKSTDNKSKNRQMGLYQAEKLMWQAGHSWGRDKEVQTTMY